MARQRSKKQQAAPKQNVSHRPRKSARGLKALLESMPEFEIPERVRTIRVRKIEF